MPKAKSNKDETKIEDVACNYLKLSGYKILEKNYQNKIAKIDVIAQDKKTDRIVFVLVKYRRTLNYAYGREKVTEQNLFKVKQSATFYLKSIKKLDQPVRIDVIEIMPNQILHLVAIQ